MHEIYTFENMITEPEQQADTVQLWKFIKKNLKFILIFGGIGFTCALVSSLFLDKEYKSTGTVYPPSGPSVEASIDNPNFGYDVEADRLIQIFKSNEIRDSVVKKFDLMNYYKLNENKKEDYDKLIKLFQKNIRFERTPSMSIVITAQTKSPELSADIINYIIACADNMREKIYKQNIKTLYESALEDYTKEKRQVDSLQLILNKTLKENNLNSLVILASNSQISIDLDKLMAKTNNNAPNIGNDIIAFKNRLGRLYDSEGKLIRLKKILDTPTPKLFVIDYAEPRYKKVFPINSLNALIGLALGVALITIILIVKNFGEQAKS